MDLDNIVDLVLGIMVHMVGKIVDSHDCFVDLFMKGHDVEWHSDIDHFGVGSIIANSSKVCRMRLDGF